MEKNEERKSLNYPKKYYTISIDDTEGVEFTHPFRLIKENDKYKCPRCKAEVVDDVCPYCGQIIELGF